MKFLLAAACNTGFVCAFSLRLRKCSGGTALESAGKWLVVGELQQPEQIEPVDQIPANRRCNFAGRGLGRTGVFWPMRIRQCLTGLRMPAIQRLRMVEGASYGALTDKYRATTTPLHVLILLELGDTGEQMMAALQFLDAYILPQQQGWPTRDGCTSTILVTRKVQLKRSTACLLSHR